MKKFVAVVVVVLVMTMTMSGSAVAAKKDNFGTFINTVINHNQETVDLLNDFINSEKADEYEKLAALLFSSNLISFDILLTSTKIYFSSMESFGADPEVISAFVVYLDKTAKTGIEPMKIVYNVAFMILNHKNDMKFLSKTLRYIESYSELVDILTSTKGFDNILEMLNTKSQELIDNIDMANG